MKRVLGLSCSVLAACAFGGSDEDPRTPVGPEPVERMDAAIPDAEEPEPMARMDASTRVDADVAPLVDAAGTLLDADIPAESCEPAMAIAVCDPVRNTGCPALTQCDIEPTATAATGRCVFYQAPLDPSACASNVYASTCAAQSACVANACRSVCYCDADCPAGERCTDTAAPGPAGVFKLCSAD
jgi:hypothetical protein